MIKDYQALILFAALLAGGCAGQHLVITNNHSIEIIITNLTIENITAGNHPVKPVPPAVQVKSANLNESFKMKVGGEAEISGTGLKIKIVGIQAPPENTFDSPSYVSGQVSVLNQVENFTLTIGGNKPTVSQEKQRQADVFGFTIYATAIVPGEVTLKVYATSPISISLLPPGGLGAATGLQATVDCSQTEFRKGVARLNWTLASRRGSEQMIEVTIYGFDGGAVERSGSLQPGQYSLVWDQLHGQAIHFWRVLTLHPDGWAPSETASFIGPLCVADMVPT